MAATIVLPRLGWTMEEGTLVEWLKRDGDPVAVGDKLFVMEGDKATEEIEAIDAGILRIPPDGPSPGTTVPVGTILGYLCAAGEPSPWGFPVASATAGATAASGPAAGAGTSSASGTTASATAPSNRPMPTGPADRRAISPRARVLAERLGIDWTQLKGSGKTGRIREQDVRAAAATATAAPRMAAPRAEDSRAESTRMPAVSAPGAGLSGELISLSSVRRTVADRMLVSLRQTAPVTLTSRADATNLVNLRRQFQSAAGTADFVPSLTELIARLVAGVLVDHPALNAVWQGEQLLQADSVHLGIAVDTPAGLVAPVVRHAQRLNLRELAQQARGLFERAREGRLSADLLQGGSFTLTNLGMLGVDSFTPILNYPQVAILGVGRIVREPVAQDDQVVVRDQMWLSLTFDHRAVDGAPAARLLAAIRAAIENPGPRLVA